MGLLIRFMDKILAFHVICSLPHPSGHPRDKKFHFLGFHLITGFNVENPYWPSFTNIAWTEFNASCIFCPLLPVFSPLVTKVNFLDFAR